MKQRGTENLLLVPVEERSSSTNSSRSLSPDNNVRHKAVKFTIFHRLFNNKSNVNDDEVGKVLDKDQLYHRCQVLRVTEIKFRIQKLFRFVIKIHFYPRELSRISMHQ